MTFQLGRDDSSNPLLTISLSATVPLWILKIQNEGWNFNRILEQARVCGDVIAHKGDIILYKSKKAGETAAAFNRLAEGIGCLAFAPGGVTVFGMHFQAAFDPLQTVQTIPQWEPEDTVLPNLRKIEDVPLPPVLPEETIMSPEQLELFEMAQEVSGNKPKRRGQQRNPPSNKRKR